MEYLILFSGLIAGFAAGFFTAMQRKNSGSDREELYRLEEQNKLLEKEKTQLREEYKRKTEEYRLVSAESARRQEEVRHLKTGQKSLESTREEMQKEFERAASRLFKENSRELNTAGKEQLKELLSPFKERISKFEEKVDQYYSRELEERGGLKNELNNLMKLNKQVGTEAENLTKALKGDTKQQGNWGEVILERVLEQSGLEKGREFRIQVHDRNSGNKQLRPDVVVDLPDKKHLIIDSKVSLTHYEQYFSAENEQQEQAALNLHIKSVKNHISQLHQKHYETAQSLNTPDFVILFIPIEASFTAAMRHAPNLFSEAWEKKIVPVAPTTLLATLKTVHSIWKQERRNKYAREIAEEGGKLYNKFAGFMEDMSKIEKGLDSAGKAYDEAMSKLSSGKGNLVRRAEKMRELGAKASKNIPDKYIEDE